MFQSNEISDRTMSMRSTIQTGVFGFLASSGTVWVTWLDNINIVVRCCTGVIGFLIALFTLVKILRTMRRQK
jgi:hypothetical protein